MRCRHLFLPFEAHALVGPVVFQNHREVDKMGKGASGAVRIDDAKGGTTLTYGRQFSADSGNLYSSITRETINALKAHFKDQVKATFCVAFGHEMNAKRIRFAAKFNAHVPARLITDFFFFVIDGHEAQSCSVKSGMYSGILCAATEVALLSAD